MSPLDAASRALFGVGLETPEAPRPELPHGDDPLAGLEALLEQGRAVPFTDQVRFDGRRFRGLLDASLELPGLEESDRRQLAALESEARPIPLTPDLRLPRESALATIRRARQLNSR